MEKVCVVGSGRSIARQIVGKLGEFAPYGGTFNPYVASVREDEFITKRKTLPLEVFDKRKKRKKLARKMRRGRS